MSECSGACRSLFSLQAANLHIWDAETESVVKWIFRWMCVHLRHVKMHHQLIMMNDRWFKSITKLIFNLLQDSDFDSTGGLLGATMGRLKLLSRGSQTKIYCYMLLFALFVFTILYWVIKLRWFNGLMYLIDFLASCTLCAMLHGIRLTESGHWCHWIFWDD